MTEPLQAARQFELPGDVVCINVIGRGNVNDTYEVVCRSGTSDERAILQRINRHVFAHPEWIMQNMKIVTEHVARLLKEEPCTGGRTWRFPAIIPTRAGRDFYMDPEGECWRAITLIGAATSYETVQSESHAEEAGTVLGRFHSLISSVDAESLHDTLEGFHVCPGYLAKYDYMISSGLAEGSKSVSRLEQFRSGQGELARLRQFVDARRELAYILENPRENGELRMRPIHGDPKVDNIMIDDHTGEGIGIVDLDTVKPGLIHYDFGDALRSICNPAGEDAAKLESVVFDVGLCRAFVRGYMVHAGGFLTDADRRYLYDATRLLPFELGLRFFEDYLAGDVYFKVRREDQNLNRARVQFALCESIERQESGIRGVVQHAG